MTSHCPIRSQQGALFWAARGEVCVVVFISCLKLMAMSLSNVPIEAPSSPHCTESNLIQFEPELSTFQDVHNTTAVWELIYERYGTIETAAVNYYCRGWCLSLSFNVLNKLQLDQDQSCLPFLTVLNITRGACHKAGMCMGWSPLVAGCGKRINPSSSFHFRWQINFNPWIWGLFSPKLFFCSLCIGNVSRWVLSSRFVGLGGCRLNEGLLEAAPDD